MRRLRGTRLLALAILVLVGPRPAGAIRVVQVDELTLPADDRIEDEVLLIAPKVEWAGVAQDDLFVLGNDLRLGGRFEQDLWALAEDVRLTGRVGSHARLFGKLVSLEGADVGAGALLMGGTVRIDDESRLGRNVRIVAEDAILRGHIEGRTRVQAQRVRLGGSFAGDVEIDATDLAVLPGTVIEGDLIARLPDPLVLDPRVRVGGQILTPPPEPAPGLGPGIRRLVRLLLLAGAYLSALPLAALFPATTRRAVERLRRTPWRCALCGAIVFGAVPPMILLAAVTVVGIPLALLLAAGSAALAWYAQVAVALVLGPFLLRCEPSTAFPRVLLLLAAGLIPIYLLSAVPGLAALLLPAVLLFGQGAFCLAVYDGESRAARDGQSGPPAPESASN